MNLARVVTPYSGSGTQPDPYRPTLADDYPGVAAWTDVTGQPSRQITPRPNAYTVEIQVDDPTLAAIQQDPAYVVLWAELIPPETTP